MQTPARPFTCSCFGHFKNHFVKKSWLLISLVTLFFFHMMEALSGTQKLRNGFKKGDTTELLKWKKKKSSNDISFTRVAPSYVTEMLLLYRPWRSLRSASKKLLGFWIGLWLSVIHSFAYGTHCQNLPAIMMILQTLTLLWRLTYFVSISVKVQ